MVRVLFWITLLLSLCTDVLSAQSSTDTRLEGMVTDAETGNPLIGATVILRLRNDRVLGDITDRNGLFLIEKAPVDTAVLEVRYVGYRTYRDTLKAAPGIGRLKIAMEISHLQSAPISVIGTSVRNRRELTGTATTVTGTELRTIAPIGTQEILEYVPGINGFADDGIGSSRISVGIRGLNPRRSSRILFLEDGIPIQPALYVYPNMYYNPPPERIDRMEVIKGSAAVEYGPQTMGGVINYITHRPTSRFGLHTEATGGTNGYLSVFGQLGGWGTETIQPELQLLFKRGDGFRENNSFEQYNGTFKLNLLPDDQHFIYLKANVNHEVSNATYTGLTEYSFRTDPTFNPKENDLFTVTRGALDLIYTRELSETVTGTSKAYINYFQRDWWRENDVFVRASEYDPANPDDINPVPYFESGDLVRVGNGRDNFGILRTFSVLGLEQTYEIGHTLAGEAGHFQIGGRLHWERFKDDRKVGDAPDARDGIYYRVDPEDTSRIIILGQSNHYETTALALHGSERLQLGALTATAGLRFEVFEQEQINRLQGSIYSDKTSMVLLPGLGLNYDLGTVNLFGGIHRGYTPPSSGALQVLNFGLDAGGLDLEAEKSWNTEIGFRAYLPWLSAEVAGFHVSIEDMVAAGRGTVFKNLGKVATYGVESGGTLKASEFFAFLPDLNFSYTYLQTEILSGRLVSAVVAGKVEVDVSGNELPYAPHHTVTAGLSRTFPFGLTLRADVHYVDRVFTDFENIETTTNRGDTGPIPAYTTISATAEFTLNDQWRFLINGKNLTDEIYVGSRLHSNPAQPEAGQSSGILPGPRRQLNVTASYTFWD